MGPGVSAGLEGDVTPGVGAAHMQPTRPSSAPHCVVTVAGPPCSVRGRARAAGTPLPRSLARGMLRLPRPLLENSAQPGWLSTHTARVTPLTPLHFRHELQPICWRGPRPFISTKTPPKKVPNPLVLAASQTSTSAGPFLGQKSPSHRGRQGQESPALGSTDCLVSPNSPDLARDLLLWGFSPQP